MKTKEQLAREHSQVTIEQVYGSSAEYGTEGGLIETAYIEGWDACLKHLSEIPWDEAMNEICNHITDNRPEIPNSSKKEKDNE